MALALEIPEARPYRHEVFSDLGPSCQWFRRLSCFGFDAEIEIEMLTALDFPLDGRLQFPKSDSSVSTPSFSTMLAA